MGGIRFGSMAIHHVLLGEFGCPRDSIDKGAGTSKNKDVMDTDGPV